MELFNLIFRFNIYLRCDFSAVNSARAPFMFHTDISPASSALNMRRRLFECKWKEKKKKQTEIMLVGSRLAKITKLKSVGVSLSPPSIPNVFINSAFSFSNRKILNLYATNGAQVIDVRSTTRIQFIHSNTANTPNGIRINLKINFLASSNHVKRFSWIFGNSKYYVCRSGRMVRVDACARKHPQAACSRKLRNASQTACHTPNKQPSILFIFVPLRLLHFNSFFRENQHCARIPLKA